MLILARFRGATIHISESVMLAKTAAGQVNRLLNALFRETDERTGLIFLVLESLVLSQDRNVIEQTTARLQEYRHVAASAMMHLEIASAMGALDTLPLLLTDLAVNIDAVTIMIFLEDAMNEPLRQESITLHLKVCTQ